MKIVLSHTTSLRILRDEALKESIRSSFVLAESLQTDCAEAALAEITRLLDLGEGEKIDVLYGDANDRSRAKSVRPHVTHRQWRSSDFERLGENLYTSAPELALVQCAQAFGGEHSPELLALVCELCGCYRLPGGLSQPMVKAKRITSSQKIEAALSRYRGLRGTKAMAKILPLCFDNSFSPRETALALILTLPTCKGGFGLPRPLLNRPVSTPKAQEVSELKPDLLWPEARVAVEFESDQFHSGQRYGRDSWRRTVLNNHGIDVITATSLQLTNMHYFDQLAENIARHLGVRIRIRSEKYPQCHQALCNALLRQYRMPPNLPRELR